MDSLDFLIKKLLTIPLNKYSIQAREEIISFIKTSVQKCFSCNEIIIDSIGSTVCDKCTQKHLKEVMESENEQ